MSITITHTAQSGSLLDGTSRGDGTAELIKPLGWRWGRSISCWYLPRTRDKAPRVRDLERTEHLLREAGYLVELEIDSTYRSTAAAEADLAAQQRARAHALASKAERKETAAEAAAEAAQRAHNALPPMGEPIKLGHHSERGHRAAIARADATTRRSIDADVAARQASDRARAASTAGDYRHHPDRVARRIVRLEAELARWKRQRDGHTRTLAGGYKEISQPATGARAERVNNEIAHVSDQLEYWRDLRAAQIASGQVIDYAAAGIQVGDFIKHIDCWLRVTRVNAKSVTTIGPRGRATIPFLDIDAHRPAHAEEGRP